MRKLSLALLTAMLAMPLAAASDTSDPTRVAAGTYTVDPTHATVLAQINHLGFSHTTVRFDAISGTIVYDPAKPAEASANIAIDIASLNSGFAMRDEHLRGVNWFNAAAFPRATFVSHGLEPTGANTANMVGDLTIHGVTKPVTLAVTFNGYGTGMDRKTRVGLSATGTLNRSEFGMAGMIGPIADEVALEISAEFSGS